MLWAARPRERSPMPYDAFISYNRSDEMSVRRIAEGLKSQDLEPYLDIWYLKPGQPWQERLEEDLLLCKAVVVVLGPSGMGDWQHREYRLAIDRQAKERGFSVIPLLLPGTEDPSPGFLTQNTWIDFRKPAVFQDEIAALVRALRGDKGDHCRADPRGSICPYRGLGAFREEDASFYFGRTQQIEDVVEKLKSENFLAVVGPSGSGKSSLIYAGIFPKLRDTRAENTWALLSLTPGKEPLNSLARLVPFAESLDGHQRKMQEIERVKDLESGKISLSDWADVILENQRGTDRLLLLVDQWEELYTEAAHPVQRGKANDSEQVTRFIDQILNATADEKITVVMTMRGDFYGTAVSYRPLADRLKDSVIPLGPMNDEETLDVIKKPAEKAELRFERGLAELIQRDLGSEPGRLPLLEFLLKRLWDRRSRESNTLLYEEYESIGGVDGAIAQQANETLETLLKKDPAFEEQTRRLFVRLVNPGEGREDTRARIAYSPSGADNKAARVVKVFTEARLLVASGAAASAPQEDFSTDIIAVRQPYESMPIPDSSIEIAHEALIKNWERLGTWVDQSREFLRTVQRIGSLKVEWLNDDRNPERLLPIGRPLEEARELLKRKDQLIDDLREFIMLSIELRREEAERKRIEEQQRLDERAAYLKKISRRTFVGAIGSGAFATAAAGASYRVVNSERDNSKLRQQLNAQKNAKTELARWTQIVSKREPQAPPIKGGPIETVITGTPGKRSLSNTATPSPAIKTIGADISANTGDGVVVGVIDSGINPEHFAFRDLEIVQRDFTREGNKDRNGHGTTTASVICGGT